MRFAPLFHDSAVLQRDIPIPIWGIAEPDHEVTVTLAGMAARTMADPQGRWLVRLPPLAAGGPHRLSAETSSSRAVADDVLVGEVWLCSGQSNMEWKLSESGPAYTAAGDDLPAVRLLTIATPARLGRQEAIDGRWTACSAQSLASFSAVAGWFGRDLHRRLGVPIGLICNAWGGTRIEAWMSREALVQDPSGSSDLRQYESSVFAADRPAAGEYVSMEDWERRGAPRDAGNRGLAEGWAEPAFDDAEWPTMPVPSRWQHHGHPGSGVFWFRRRIAVPSAWAGCALELRLGAIDKHDDAWVNGVRVGGMSWESGPGSWSAPRIYRIPGELVGPDGQLCIAVRVRSHMYHGGMIGPAADMRFARIDRPDDAMPLDGTWRYGIEQDWGVVSVPPFSWGPGNPNSPYVLFDSRVSPVVPYGMRGVIWYQGESNAPAPEHYRRQVVSMVRDWRRAWGQGDFPFLQVQLANYSVLKESPAFGKWAALREAQLHSTAEPGVGMAVTIDVGESRDIHPKDKRSVGQRLARWALAGIHGFAGAPSGPLYESAVAEAGGRTRIRFRFGSGLATRDGGPVRQLVIAGIDRSFLPAESKIEEDCLIVWHPKVLRPAAVRYAWMDDPIGSNLVGADALPASPFRTDHW